MCTCGWESYTTTFSRDIAIHKSIIMIIGLNSLFICNNRQRDVLFVSVLASSVLLAIIGPCLSELTSVDEANVCGPKSIDVKQARTVRVRTVCPAGVCQVTRLQYFLTTKYYLHCCAGFSQTNTSCSQACEPDRFGENCTETCVCESNRCNSVIGTCECLLGYKGINCTEQCEKGTYGVNCRGNCTCQNGGTCNITDGTCKCPTGIFGENCEMAVEITTAPATATLKDSNDGQINFLIIVILVTVVCSFLVIVVVCFMIAWRFKWLSICKPNDRPNPNLSAPVNDEVTINSRGPEAIQQIYMNDITHTYIDTIITTPPPNQWNKDPVAYAESSAFSPQPQQSDDGMRSPAANGDEQYAYAYGHTTQKAGSPSAHPSGNAIENEDNNVARSTAPTGIANSSQSLYVNDKLIKQGMQRQSSSAKHSSGNQIGNQDSRVASSIPLTDISPSQSVYVNDKLIKQRLQHRTKMSTDL